MRPILLPDGRPGERLGISHTLKHYLDPREMWEDICDEVEPALRPRAVAERLPVDPAPPWDQWAAPSEALTAAWAQLRPAYREGYAWVILGLAGPVAEPHVPGEPWIRCPGGLAVHLGEGVVMRVTESRAGWRLWTAYRPVDFKLRRHECPPRDARSVSIRRAIARLQAERHVARWREENEE